MNEQTSLTRCPQAWCINLDKRPERLNEFMSQKIPFPVARFRGIEMSNGALGCLTSHMEVMKLFGDGLNMIFEDDFMLVNKWMYVDKALMQLPMNWHCLYLGAMLHQPLNRWSENVFQLRMGWACHGVIYNGRTIADEILKHSPAEIHGKWRNIDTWMAQEVQTNFNCFVISPIVGVQRPGFSDNIHRYRNYDMIKKFNQMTGQ